MTITPEPESFAAFKKSFSYGTRNDLNFKFLAGLPDEETALFFQELLDKLGDTLDDGDLGRLIEHVRAWQARGYGGPGRWTYDDGPFTPLPKPLAQCRVGLVASSGHFVAGDDPAPFGIVGMTQEQAVQRIDDFLKGPPQLSAIPADTPGEHLQVRHGGYDIRGALADPNVALPLERMRELGQEGAFGALAERAYAFVGACSQVRLTRHEGPAWVPRLRAEMDAAVLVPV